MSIHEPDWYDWDRHHGGLTLKDLRTGKDIFEQGDNAGELEDQLDAIVDIWFSDPDNKEGRGPQSMNEHLDLILCNYFDNE